MAHHNYQFTKFIFLRCIVLSVSSYKLKPLLAAVCLSIALAGCSTTPSSDTAASAAVYGNASSFCLDRVARQDIFETDSSVNLPVDILVPTEKVSKDDIKAARIMAEKTLKGEIGKRKPITVVKRGDGRFSIIDGNRTFSYLAAAGAKSVPAEVTFPYTKDIRSVDELIARNNAVKAEFIGKLKEIQKKVGGDLQIRPDKARARIQEKVEKLYQNNIGGVTDILGGRLVFAKSEGILNSLDYIKGREDVISYLDRWNTPLESGYMDVVCFVRMSNGVIGELQFALKGIIDINDLDHKLYEYLRSHPDDAAYKENDRRIINIKKKLIRLAVEDKGDSITKLKPQMIVLSEKLLKTKTPKKGEHLISKLEELVKKI